MLDEIGAYLEAQGLGTLATDLFLGEMPSEPDTCVVVHEYEGGPPVHFMGIAAGTAIWEQPRVQVMTRSKSYATARSKAKDAFNKLDGHSGTLSGTEYGYIRALGSPGLLGKDGNDRVLVVCNFEVVKKLS